MNFRWSFYHVQFVRPKDPFEDDEDEAEKDQAEAMKRWFLSGDLDAEADEDEDLLDVDAILGVLDEEERELRAKYMAELQQDVPVSMMNNSPPGLNRGKSRVPALKLNLMNDFQHPSQMVSSAQLVAQKSEEAKAAESALLFELERAFELESMNDESGKSGLFLRN